MDSPDDELLLQEQKLVDLYPLAREVPNIDAAVAEIARYSAELTLPQGTIHVISDIHGEDQKLRHVINNASGTLRPLVERLFQEHLTPPIEITTCPSDSQLNDGGW
jgi:fructose-1,6-bisphosphatase III